MSTLGGGACVISTSVQGVETITGLYKIYIIYEGKPEDLYKHIERNVMVHIRLKYNVSS
jgi:hypothetical protein